MPYGRNLQIKGCSRRVCCNLECTTRITDIIKKNKTCIVDRNYCAKHQPIILRDYIINHKTLPHNYLTLDEHLKEWFEIIFEIENIISNEDIYNYSRINFAKYVSQIMSKIPDLCGEMIKLFPERNLKWYKWKIIPENYLNIEHNRKELFDAFLFDNNILLNSDDIYNISLEMLESHKASTLFNHYRHSIPDIILNLYPERIIIPWYFKGHKFYFQDNKQVLIIENVKKWFEYEIVSEKPLNLVLKNITSVDFGDVYGGSFLWNLFNGSVFEFINTIYPEYNIKAWELKILPSNYFKNKGKKDLIKLKEWLEWIGNKLGYTSMEDYYNLGNLDIKDYCGITILKYGTLKSLIMEVFKDFPFDINKFKTSQERLRETNNIIYGCDYPMQNAEQAEKCGKNSYAWKNYTFPCGTIVKYQGYENLGYDELIKEGYILEDIIVSRTLVPEIWYMNNNRKHRYYVDIYIPLINKMIEIKSTRTYQLKLEDNIFLKANACIKQGFDYEIWVYADNKGRKKEIITEFN